jgi:hypothetical protein
MYHVVRRLLRAIFDFDTITHISTSSPFDHED